MLGKMLVFCFCLIGIFALLMATLPNEFITASYVYNPSYRSAEIKEEFDANNLIVYDQTGNDNMTFEYSSLDDGPSPPDWEAGLPDNQFLEISWGYPFVNGIILTTASMQARHRQRNWFGPLAWYSTLADLTFYSSGIDLGIYLDKDELVDSWSSTNNASAFSIKGGQIASSLLVKPYNYSFTIGQNWDNGTLNYLLSYEANLTASGIGAFTLISQLLTFQAPSLGIGGPWGSFLNLVIAIPMWSCIAYIVYKVIAGLIPFVSGGSGD